jgi:hypothetical protein
MASDREWRAAAASLLQVEAASSGRETAGYSTITISSLITFFLLSEFRISPQRSVLPSAFSLYAHFKKLG